jgi:hypothetical protein
MPVGGRPKPPGQAVTRNPRLEWTEVPDVPFRGGPECPQRQGPKCWPPGVRERWKVWSTMPHCVLWAKADWQFAVDTLH